MSDVLPLKNGITYGPVNSRRLGRSLGINLLPPGRKWCTFDCLYCQYGWTPPTEGSDPSVGVPSPKDVERAAASALAALDPLPAYLTFSGNGEPTLHPGFAEIVEIIRRLRDRMAPRAKVALLSNSAGVVAPSMRAAICRIEHPVLKLDAGNEFFFRAYNRPVPGIDYDAVVRGLKETPGIMIQTLFTAGPKGNLQEAHLDDWIGRIKEIRPVDIQIYTLARPVPSPDITPAPAAALIEIRDRLRREGLSAQIF
jgi:wyosine [tRNA(Phe)-imidazoG37] synthetase (radical SAM superfamily)